MQKNVAGQFLTVYVWDSTTGLPKTGDAANLTAYRAIDGGSVTVLTDTSAAEKDATNAKGYYQFDLSQAETNGDVILFSCKSATANMVCRCTPDVVATVPAGFAAATNAVGSIATGGIAAASFAAGAINAAALAADAVAEIWTTALTESYAADGAAPTPAQFLFQLWSFTVEAGNSGVTRTTKKLDGSTTAMTFTYDSSTQPTSITRAS